MAAPRIPDVTAFLMAMVTNRQEFSDLTFEEVYMDILARNDKKNKRDLSSTVVRERLPRIPLVGFASLPQQVIGSMRSPAQVSIEVIADALVQPIDANADERMALRDALVRHLQCLKEGKHCSTFDETLLNDQDYADMQCAYTAHEVRRKAIVVVARERSVVHDDTDSSSSSDDDDDGESSSDEEEVIETTLTAVVVQEEEGEEEQSPIAPVIIATEPEPVIITSEPVLPIPEPVVVAVVPEASEFNFLQPSVFERRVLLKEPTAIQETRVHVIKPDGSHVDAPALVSTEPETALVLKARGFVDEQDDRTTYAGIYVEKVPREQVTAYLLECMALLVSRPWAMGPNGCRDILAWVTRYSRAYHIRLFVGSPHAWDYLRLRCVPDGRMPTFLVRRDKKQHARAVREYSEALFLAWLIGKHTPEHPWDALLLMYATMRACSLVAETRTRAGADVDRAQAGGDLIDALKQKYAGARDYLAEKYDQYVTPRLRQFSEMLTREQLQAATEALSGYAKQAYDTAAKYGSQAAQKVREYAQRVKESVQGIDSERFVNMAKNTRDWLRVRTHAIAEYLRTHMGPALERLKEFARQAQQRGQDMWTYAKTLPPRAKQLFDDSMSKLDQQMVDAGVAIKNWVHTKVPVEAEKVVANVQERIVQDKLAQVQQDRPLELDEWQMPASDSRSLANLVHRRQQQVIENQQRQLRALEQQSPPADNSSAVSDAVVRQLEPVASAPLSLSEVPRPLQTRTYVAEQPPPLPPRDFDDETDMSGVPLEPDMPFPVAQPPRLPTSWNAQTAEQDKDQIVMDLRNRFDNLGYWLSNVADTQYYNPSNVSSIIGLTEQMFASHTDERKQEAAYDSATYRVLASVPVLEHDVLARNKLIGECVHTLHTLLSEHAYAGDADMSTTVDRLLATGRLSQSQVDDVYALVRLMNDHKLEQLALRGPYGSVREQGQSAHTDLVQEQIARDWYRRHGTFESAAHCREARFTAYSLHELLADPHASLMRAQVFRERAVGPSHISRTTLLLVRRAIERAAQAYSRSEPMNAHQALHALEWHAESDNALRLIHWIHASAVLVDCTARETANVQRYTKDAMHLGSAGMLDTWDRGLQPILEHLYSESGQDFGPYSLANMNEAFEQWLAQDVARGAPSTSTAHLRRLMDAMDTTNGGLRNMSATTLHAQLLAHRYVQYTDHVRISEDMRQDPHHRATVSLVVQMMSEARSLRHEIQKYGVTGTLDQASTVALLQQDERFARTLLICNVDAWEVHMQHRINYVFGMRGEQAELASAQEPVHWDPTQMLVAKAVDEPSRVLRDAYDREHPSAMQFLSVANEVMQADSYAAVDRVLHRHGLAHAL